MMEFSDSRPIYRQILDYCFGCITSGQWAVDGRIPSVKELATELSVNTRTVLKAFDLMHDLGVIYQKRGLGYFVAPDAAECIRADRRREFIATTLPEFQAQMRLAGLTPEEIIPLLQK